jgi:hypothetical protein
MRKYFPMYKEAVSHICLCSCTILNFLIYEENLIFFFINAEMDSRKKGLNVSLPLDLHLQCTLIVGGFIKDEYCS